MDTIQRLLNQILLERKKKNPQFSMRAMAKLMGVSSSQLSKLMQGKKRLTARVALKAVEKLSLSGEQAEIIMEYVQPNLVVKRRSRPRARPVVLSEADMMTLSDWQHLAILSLCRVKNNKAQAKWIASRLGIDELAAQEALDRLIKMKLIWIDEGQLVRVESQLTTSQDVASRAIKMAHKKTLDLAQKKLDSVPVEDRQFTYITTAVDPLKIKKAKKMILDFREELSLEMGTGNPTEVYTLSIQLFPLTELRKNEF